MKEIFEKTDKTGGERYLLLDVGGTDGMIRGVGMAIPGPFDYEHGISRMQD